MRFYTALGINLPCLMICIIFPHNTVTGLAGAQPCMGFVHLASAASGSARDAAVELLLALTLNLPCWVLLGVVLSSWDVKML